MKARTLDAFVRDAEATSVTLEEIRRALELHRPLIDERAAARAAGLAQKR